MIDPHVLIESALGQRHVDHVEATAELALAHIMLRQYTVAGELLQRARSVVEGDPDPSYNLARATINAYLADIHMREGRAERALPLYRLSLVRLRGMPTVSKGVVALLHDRLAWAEIAASRNYVQAERHLTHAATVFEWYRSRQQKVREQQWTANGVPMAVWPLAEHRDRAFLGRAGTLLPHALRSLAAVQFTQGKVDDAITTLQQLRRLTPDAVNEDRSTVADLRVLDGLIRTSTFPDTDADGPADRWASDRCATMPLSIAVASGYVTRQALNVTDPQRMFPSISEMVPSVSRFGGGLR